MKQHVLPKPFLAEWPQCSRGAHVKQDTCSTAVHNAVQIRVVRRDHELKLDITFRLRVEELDVVHQVGIETGEVGGFRDGTVSEMWSAMGKNVVCCLVFNT